MRKLDDIFPHFNFLILVLVITVIARDSQCIHINAAYHPMLEAFNLRPMADLLTKTLV